MTKKLTLKVLPGRFAVCRMDADAPAPADILNEPFFSIMRTEDELSFTIPEGSVKPGWQAEKGWRILKVLGPLDFGMTGVLSSIAVPLAEAGISIFVSSTYDSDYVMVKEPQLSSAVDTLQAEGFEIIPAG